MPGPAVAAIGAGVIGGVAQASAASKAAKAQSAAADKQMAVQKAMYDQTRSDLAPYRESGLLGQQAAQSMLGLGAAPEVNGTPWSFETSPGYQFNLNEGMNALNASAATRGGLLSGATLKAAQKFGSGLASNEYWQTYNALAGMGTVGQNAAAQTGAAAQNYAQGASNALANLGNAQASGAIATGNAINGGITNALGAYGYMTQLNKNLTGNPLVSGVY